MRYAEENAAIIDRWAEQYGLQWMQPIDHETFLSMQKGTGHIRLTPVRDVPQAWLGDVRGLRVPGLAAGGGQQMAALSAMGARCTVLDISEKQLGADRLVAEREGYDIELLHGDMAQPLPFAENTFDMVINPVSNHYIEQAEPVFREVYRVLKAGGVFLAGLDTGIYWALDESEEHVAHALPLNPNRNPSQRERLLNADMGLQFSHTLEEQIGGQLRAGLRLMDLYEDTNGAGRLHELNVPTFIATRAVKPLV